MNDTKTLLFYFSLTAAVFLLFCMWQLGADDRYISYETQKKEITLNLGDISYETAKTNINTADTEELEALPGIGEKTAAAIMEYRDKNGDFAAPEDIMNVKGIGEKKYNDIKDIITTE